MGIFVKKIEGMDQAPQEWGGAKDSPAPSLRGPWDKLTPEMGPRASLRLSRYTPIQARRGCRFHRQELRP